MITPTVKQPAKVHAWGAISAQGTGRLHLFTGILTATGYEQILRNQLCPTFLALHHRPRVLFQDQDPKHSSKRCRDLLEDHLIEWIDSPPQSPDLNPLENVWATLKERVGARTAKQ